MLSVLALLVPAGGIAYLGAVSYRDEHDAVTSQLERQDRAAQATVQQIDRAIEAALAAADRAAAGDRSALANAPLARYWFWLDADGRIREPRSSLPEVIAEGGVDRGVNRNALVGPVDDYLRELSRRQDRAVKLRAAQRSEACRGDACSATWAEARREYTALVGFDDTAPEALLGLARVQTRLGDTARATATLGELDRRFGDRSFPEGGSSSERVPVRLVTALMRAEAARDAVALLDVAEAVLAGRYAVEPVVGVGIATRIRGELAADKTPAITHRIAVLDAQLAAIRETARAAAGLAQDADAIAHAATPAWRGQPASHNAGRTLVYERRGDKIIGIAVDAAMLADVAGPDAARGVAAHGSALVLPVGGSPPAGQRLLAQVPLGERLPHLALALVHPLGDPDPLDEVIRVRSQRHVIWTSGLALLLGVGLLATIRGAARARELARTSSRATSSRTSRTSSRRR